MTAPLKVPLAALVDHSRVAQYRGLRIEEADIALSTASGLDARDVKTLRAVTGAHALAIVVRCPKPDGRALQGVVPPKPMHVKEKSGAFGLVGTGSREAGDAAVYVSDYDLMGIWRFGDGGWRPLPLRDFPGALDATTSSEASALVRGLNERLVAPIQHGCQDDFHDARNPGVSAKDHFAIFDRGRATHVRTFAECAAEYRRRGWAWHYGVGGRYPWPPLAKPTD
jgi:hypothetical protein